MARYQVRASHDSTQVRVGHGLTKLRGRPAVVLPSKSRPWFDQIMGWPWFHKVRAGHGSTLARAGHGLTEVRTGHGSTQVQAGHVSTQIRLFQIYLEYNWNTITGFDVIFRI
jgi:hypothetical protein